MTKDRIILCTLEYIKEGNFIDVRSHWFYNGIRKKYWLKIKDCLAENQLVTIGYNKKYSFEITATNGKALLRANKIGDDFKWVDFKEPICIIKPHVFLIIWFELSRCYRYVLTKNNNFTKLVVAVFSTYALALLLSLGHTTWQILLKLFPTKTTQFYHQSTPKQTSIAAQNDSLKKQPQSKLKKTLKSSKTDFLKTKPPK